jgi:hypothetical protein
MRKQRRNFASFWKESNKIPPPFYVQSPLYLDEKWNYLAFIAIWRRANPLAQNTSALAVFAMLCKKSNQAWMFSSAVGATEKDHAGRRRKYSSICRRFH